MPPPLPVPQVYRARVRATGQEVAVKVQRPAALATISKDLYVMRRAVGVYERLVRRFTAQTTDYQRLVSTFAEGLYTEMDFRNEVRLCLCVGLYVWVWVWVGGGGRASGGLAPLPGWRARRRQPRPPSARLPRLVSEFLGTWYVACLLGAAPAQEVTPLAWPSHADAALLRAPQALNAQRMAQLLAERCAAGLQAWRTAACCPCALSAACWHAGAPPRLASARQLLAPAPSRPVCRLPPAGAPSCPVPQRVLQRRRRHPAAAHGADHAAGADNGVGDGRQADHPGGEPTSPL